MSIAPSSATTPIPSLPTRAEPKRQRIDQLQMLRFGAAFAVVLFHLGDSARRDFGFAQNYFKIGGVGVDIFFVLSGFVIAYSARPERGALYFFVRRIARIVPLYWFLTLGIAAVALLAPKLLNSTHLDLANLLRSLLFIPYERQDGQIMPLLFLGWTLNYEMFFYAVFGLSLLIRPYSPLYSCVPILALVALGSGLRESDSTLVRFYTNPIMINFVLGVLLFMIWQKAGEISIATWQRRGFVVLAVVLSILGFAIDTGAFQVIVHGLSAALLVAAVLVAGAPKGTLAGVLLLLGNASYSLYLSHPYVLQGVSKLIGAGHSWYVVAMGLTAAAVAAVGLSLALYFIIELPGQRLLLQWWDPKRGKA